jgi:cobalt-zinc-cadmium efflux system outer membrane protein
MFEENNLELRLVMAQRDAVAGLARQARAHPNPVATVTHEGLSESGADYSESYFLASQRLEWPGRRDGRIASSDGEAAVARTRADAERLRLAFEVKRSYLQAAAAEEQLVVIEEVRDVFRFAEESGRQRFREGDLSGYDARRIRIERARYENVAMSQTIALRNARLLFASLILSDSSGEEPPNVAPAAVPEGSPPSLSDLDDEAALEGAFERRREMRSAEAQVTAAEGSVRYRSTFRYPDVTLTGGYKRQSDGFDGFFVGASLPVPLFDQKQGDVDAAEARLRTATAHLALTQRTIANDVRRTFSTYLSVSERAALIRDQLLSGVDDLLRIARVSYGEGEMSLLELLDAAEAYRESQIALSELTSELWIRYYDLERAIGGFSSISVEDQP